MKVHRFVLAFVPFFLSTTSLVFAEKSKQQYLDEGNDFFTKGQYDDALISFGAAISKLDFIFFGESYFFLRLTPKTINYI
jgi:hypothetical protein